MPVLLGIILGVILTVTSAYLYDTSTGRAANALAPSAADGHPPLVNWPVVNEDWKGVRTNLEHIGENLENGWRRLRS
jgi:hypothetical protein